MSRTKFHKKVSRKLGVVALVGAHQLIRILPEPFFRGLKSFLIAVGRPFVLQKKKLAYKNVSMVFEGQKSEEEINEIVEGCFDSMAAGMIELIYFIDRPDKIMERVAIEGQEHLDEALKAGNGAILMSAHFGNFVLMLFRMVLAGYETNCMTRRTRDEQFERYITKLRNHRGFRTIYAQPRRQCITASLKCLRKKELLFILFDQNYGDDGQVFVDFFGRKAATATGPVVLSQRTGAPVLPAFIVSEGRDRYRIKIEKPVAFAFDKGDQEELVENVATLTKIVEKYVTLYPEQWGGWLHRRWKTRPPPEK